MAAVALLLLVATRSSQMAGAFQPLLVRTGGLMPGGKTLTFRTQEPAQAAIRTMSPPASFRSRCWRSAPMFSITPQLEGDDFFLDQQMESDGDDFFYNREMETEELLKDLNCRPEKVLVIVGPQNSGKTRLLKEVLYGRELPPFHIDARRSPITSAKDLIVALHEAAFRWLQTEKTERRMGNAVTAKLPLEDLVGVGQVRIKDVLDVYISMLETAKQMNNVSTEAPVIWIDEVNTLMEWHRKDRQEMQALLRFFVLITKQDAQAHVVLSTSEYAFVSWLEQEISPAVSEIMVIGDFSETAARGYAQLCLNRSRRALGNAPVAITDSEWVTIYEVCGGNPQDLKRAMGKWGRVEKGAPRMDSLETALSEIWRRRYNRLHRAVSANPAFAFVAQQLCKAPYGALPCYDLDAALSENGLGSLEDLVRDNLVAVRPMSPWAYDLPAEVFVNDCDVATAASVCDLFCMKRLKTQGILPGPGH